MDELGHEATVDNCGIMADPEALILVDEADRSLGHLSKALCHKGRGVLHRAFSLLIFNDRGELLLQQRAANKRLWPLYWSNSCCSHPRRAESMEVATQPAAAPLKKVRTPDKRTVEEVAAYLAEPPERFI
jgi:isopentenyl-diphosphate delta-isomerase type 1